MTKLKLKKKVFWHFVPKAYDPSEGAGITCFRNRKLAGHILIYTYEQERREDKERRRGER